jgi:hypothetical protein
MIAAQSSLSFATSTPKNSVIELPLTGEPLALINLVNVGLPVSGWPLISSDLSWGAW